MQAEPNEAQPAQLDTEVRVLVDEEAIYVSARMWDPEPDRIADLLMRRDERVTDLRTAAFLSALRKIGTSYMELGIFP